MVVIVSNTQSEIRFHRVKAKSLRMVQTEISQLLQIAIKFCTDIHDPQRMNPTHFGVTLTSSNITRS